MTEVAVFNLLINLFDMVFSKFSPPVRVRELQKAIWCARRYHFLYMYCEFQDRFLDFYHMVFVQSFMINIFLYIAKYIFAIHLVLCKVENQVLSSGLSRSIAVLLANSRKVFS